VYAVVGDGVIAGSGQVGRALRPEVGHAGILPRAASASRVAPRRADAGRHGNGLEELLKIEDPTRAV